MIHKGVVVLEGEHARTHTHTHRCQCQFTLQPYPHPILTCPTTTSYHLCACVCVCEQQIVTNLKSFSITGANIPLIKEVKWRELNECNADRSGCSFRCLPPTRTHSHAPPQKVIHCSQLAWLLCLALAPPPHTHASSSCSHYRLSLSSSAIVPPLILSLSH